ncbi:response regulator [Frankia sp. Mgl5]|uniref:response regulator n=1 Tax=Frankia sp. Mgl5 TaxID=2933793 RepID=UPI00200C07A3|nr:response regulator [Frankia sp. Mgl5]MCK9930312.1 response regulator [Frankia sp. Mgl5]
MPDVRRLHLERERMPDGRIRTLIVEADPMTAEAHSVYVEKLAGFTVSGVTHTGAQCLRQLTRDGHDLVLLDLNLPDMTGFDVCRTLRCRGAGPDIIAVTAARDVATVRTAVAYGAVQYLVKPFGFAAFRSRLECYAAFRSELMLGRTGPIGQREVDAALAALRPGTTLWPEQPKGTSIATLDAVVAYLRQAAGPMSADEIASAVGLSRVTARRYLERLTDQRLTSRTQRYGRPGRPEHLYQWRDVRVASTR